MCHWVLTSVHSLAHTCISQGPARGQTQLQASQTPLPTHMHTSSSWPLLTMEVLAKQRWEGICIAVMTFLQKKILRCFLHILRQRFIMLATVCSCGAKSMFRFIRKDKRETWFYYTDCCIAALRKYYNQLVTVIVHLVLCEADGCKSGSVLLHWLLYTSLQFRNKISSGWC